MKYASALEETAVTSAPSGSRSLCNGLSGHYSFPLHIGAIFLILFASLLGTAMPILSKYVSFIRKNPFFFTVGKTAATGVLLSVSTIHLIHEGAMAFRESCVPQWFTGYDPFYFLFALIAILGMQAIDLQLAAVAERWLKANRAEDAKANCGGGTPQMLSTCDASNVAIVDEDGAEIHPGEPSPCGIAERRETVSSDVPLPHDADEEKVICGASVKVELPSPSHHHGCSDDEAAVHGHHHLVAHVPRDMNSIRRVVSAISMEFGVTLHSVFVGLAVGLTTNAELKPLMVALVFHQMFEGMAMGSRLVDAKFEGNLETILALVFSFSAPLGMVAATIAVSISPNAMSGGGFVTMMAILDSLCGGILLYLAFTLLLGDFVEDLKHNCADGLPKRLRKKVALYAALWIGMLMMAIVGKWL